MITKELNQNTVKFDNLNLNKLIAYTSIINSLNYKWYKSSKRRFLLPNFYFTKSFYNFYNLFFLKNIFRKKIQPTTKYSLVSSLGFFEKKMFLKHVSIEDFLRSNNSYFFFFNNKNISFLRKDKFFFKKKFNNFLTNSNLFVGNNIDVDLENKNKLFIFKKSNIMYNFEVDFNILLFFHLSNMSFLEFYKILVLLSFNSIIKI